MTTVANPYAAGGIHGPPLFYISFGRERYHVRIGRSGTYFTKFAGWSLNGKRYRVDAHGRVHRPWRSAWLLWIVWLATTTVVIVVGFRTTSRYFNCTNNDNSNCPHFPAIGTIALLMLLVWAIWYVTLTVHWHQNQQRTMNIPANHCSSGSSLI